MNAKTHTPKTEQALESLNGMQRAEAPPFLYTRIRARLQHSAGPAPAWRDRLAALLARPLVAVSCVVVIMAVNLAVIFSRGTATENSSADLVADAYNANVAIADDSFNDTEQ